MATNDRKESVELIEEDADLTKAPKSADLMKARKAIKHLQGYFGGPKATKALLADLIADGELDAYARFHWTTEGRAIRKAWRAGPPEDAVERKKLKPGVFSGSSVLEEDMKKWKWRKGWFHVTHVKRGGSIRRFFYKDVRFERAAIEAMLENQKAISRELYKGGRGFDENRWGTFWLQIVLLQREGHLCLSKIADDKAFSEVVYDRYKAASRPVKPLSLNTVKGQIARAYNELFDERNADFRDGK